MRLTPQSSDTKPNCYDAAPIQAWARSSRSPPSTTARALAFALADGHRDSGGSRVQVASRRPAIGALIALAAIATGAAWFTGDGPSSSTGSPAAASTSLASVTSVAGADSPRVEIG